jgi:hypothetical protein
MDAPGGREDDVALPQLCANKGVNTGAGGLHPFQMWGTFQDVRWEAQAIDDLGLPKQGVELDMRPFIGSLVDGSTGPLCLSSYLLCRIKYSDPRIYRSDLASVAFLKPPGNKNIHLTLTG